MIYKSGLQKKKSVILQMFFEDDCVVNTFFFSEVGFTAAIIYQLEKLLLVPTEHYNDINVIKP